MSATKVVACGAARSPIGAIGGGLAGLTAFPLLTQITKAAIASAKLDPKHVEYMSAGWVMQDVRSPNIARAASEFAGAPITAPGTTLQENCASGGAAIHDISRRIQLGEIELGLAGGVESMSNVARYLFTGRTKGQMYGDMVLIDGLMGGLVDQNVGKGELMGRLTERLVEKYGVTREIQDEIAFNSHKNALAAWESGMFDYVTAVQVPGKKKGTTTPFTRDEGPQKHDMEYFKKQKPYFKPEGGTITSANSSSLNDAAAVIVLASEKRAKELGLPILAELRSYGNIGVPKELMGEGAFKILPKILKKADIAVKDVDYFEMNEAFAAVVGGALKDVPGLSLEKINQWGSGISLGHPVGCTGVRQAVDMVYQLQKRNGKVGVTSRCVGGGIGSGEVWFSA